MSLYRQASVAACLWGAFASRLKTADSIDLEDLSDEQVDDSALGKSRNPHVGGAEGCSFPAELAAKYKDAWVVGTGATACVWIAEFAGDSVAVKVAKGSGHVDEWRKECREMQELRTDACAAGAKAQLLAEMYLPTCLEVNQVGSVSYYVMQAAGKHGIKSFAKTITNDVPMQKRIFAQTVAAVYSMHGIGWTHNDLHGENIVVDDDDYVALIDFGEIKGHHRGLGKKHDANNIWRWAAALADCPEEAQYPILMKSFFAPKSKAELTDRSKELLTCLEVKWQPGQEFLTAFELVLTNTIKISEDQEIGQLYETDFVQQNLPPVTSIFPWDGEGCMSKADVEAAKATFRTTSMPTIVSTTIVTTTATTTILTEDEDDDDDDDDDDNDDRDGNTEVASGLDQDDDEHVEDIHEDLVTSEAVPAEETEVLVDAQSGPLETEDDDNDDDDDTDGSTDTASGLDQDIDEAVDDDAQEEVAMPEAVPEEIEEPEVLVDAHSTPSEGQDDDDDEDDEDVEEEAVTPEAVNAKAEESEVLVDAPSTPLEGEEDDDDDDDNDGDAETASGMDEDVEAEIQEQVATPEAVPQENGEDAAKEVEAAKLEKSAASTISPILSSALALCSFAIRF